MANYDLQRDIWTRGFGSLAASDTATAAAGSGGAARSKAVLEYGSCSLLLTEPLFNFDAVRATTEEVRRAGRRAGAAEPAQPSVAAPATAEVSQHDRITHYSTGWGIINQAI